ncbi:MAG: hydantoinase B/oxoprolinase family protein [Solirubrobacterales bacterium]
MIGERAESSEPLDGLRLAVLSNRFESIVRKMTNTLFRTARSGVINSARDFSCCILTGEGDLLATAESLPIHILSGPELIAEAMKERHPELRAGDAFLHNSPYHGNSHAADHCVLVPVIDHDGHHRFTVLVKAHVADCGNSSPTSYSPASRDVYEEGALLFPCVQLQQDYRYLEDILRLCEVRIRVPEQWLGDNLGMVGAARVGERELLELGDEEGWDTLGSYARQWFDYSERLMDQAISELPAGRVTAVSTHDPFPGIPEGLSIRATVETRPQEGTIEVDLRANPDCVPCGLNLSEATARTAAMVGVFNSIGPGIPANAGSYRRLRILLRENCVAGIPRHPASCSLATTGVADRVANAVQRGMAELGDGIGMAEAGPCTPPSSGVISGRDPRHDGAPFLNQLVLGMTAGQAGPSNDGWLNLAHVGNAGLMLRDSSEIDELRHPIRIWIDRIERDTEGAGRNRGAPSARVEFGPVDTSIEVMWASDGNLNSALGARTGGAGAPASQFKRDQAGVVTDLPAVGRISLEPGESIVSLSAGGGGYGSPLERTPDRVGHDVREGWISPERSREIYGVVVDGAGEVDVTATDELRSALKEEED